jgi:RNA polymerase sigma factor (TIGR02999 family)
MSEKFEWKDVYDAMADLRAMADKLLADESNARSLQPTALVLTALRRQKPEGLDWSDVSWETREYFFGAMRQAMKRALIDHARKRNAKKRKGIRTTSYDVSQIEDLPKLADEQPEVYIALEHAIEELKTTQPEWVLVFVYRYYNGLTIEQVAGLMKKSEKTIRNWSNRIRVLLREAIERKLTENTEEDS